MSDELQQIAIRVPEGLLSRADRLCDSLGVSEIAMTLTGGQPVKRTNVLRAALALGMRELEKRYAAELGEASPSPAAPVDEEPHLDLGRPETA